MRRLLLALLLAPGFAQAQSLPDLVREALASDPAIAAAEAQVRAAQERVVQAKAAFGPTVTGTADAAHSTYNDYLAPEARRFKSNSIGVEITQPIVHNDLIFAHDSAAAQLELQALDVGAEGFGDRRIAFVAGASDRVEAFATRLQLARDAVELAA